ncbi:aminomethyltransferase [Desulfosarcina widdelii]|uniref:Aminomethyltransferase n=1 Tax=Desulfosarcina widdelii TaxID=947919 RepID=A0A5K7ZG97_9BACT|nr:2Fe-2S iron-sulfur cluster-binding protein [Desulfosarcina widdelii]BBO78723.1 aminomethyltransferase [Desulfosarcina widdelii]
MNRLNQLPTLRIDPSEKRTLTYRGKTYQGVAGDTVASALYAGGVRVFARSLKYHRPRGLYSLDGECSNTMMDVDGIPNVRTENTPLESGMAVKAQNVVGSANFDWMAFIDKFDWMMPAGFYYKTMHKPAAIWPLAMKQIRKAAGLGVISSDYEMKGQYDELFMKAEVTVIGGGAAGMAAALAAAESGRRVVLLEARPHLGGCFDYRVSTDGDGTPLYRKAREMAEKVEKTPNIRVFTHTPMVGAYTNNLITAFQVGKKGDAFTERYIEIRSDSVVVATGCIERPLLFDNNERPGVMQVGCAHRMARTYGLLPGKQAVFSIGHDLGLEAAVDLFDLGLKIACVADIREDGQNPELLVALAERNIPVLKGWVAAKAHGGKQIKKVTLSTVEGTVKRDFDCDLLVASAGLTPVTGPFILAQAKMGYDNLTGYFLPTELPERMFSAGRLTGINDPAAIEASGRLAGLKAAAAAGADMAAAVAEAENAAAALPGPERGCKLVTAPVKGRKSFICFDEDATVKSVKQAIDKGFDVPELVKRFAGVGLGPGQSGIPGHNLPLFVAKYTASIATPKPTTVRPPLVPTFLATYAGYNHHMFKRTPMHYDQIADGGVFRNIGVWQRARYFSEDYSCKEEILNVRNNVGMLDGSTLGKFRIHGPDALKALQRVYVSDMSKVKEGRIKYSAMCNDDGCVIDDGVVVKLGENDYYFTTSTGRAGQTVEWIRYHTRFDGWNFNMVNLTDAMGVINLSGPNARKVLAKVVDIDVSNEAFAFSEYKEFFIQDTIFVRAMRLGFVGELSYELHVPSSYMKAVWDMLKDAGAEFGIRNFGVEAQNVLRMEKCHIILGQESEQRTNLLDVGLGFLWDRRKTDAKTVGAVALRQAENKAGRLKLVGIRMEDDDRPARDGALIVDSKVRGYVATMRKSFTTGQAVGMALVESQLADKGTRLEIFEDECNGVRLYARVVDTPFYDPSGERMKS